jgi:hypothetical protein
MQIDLSEALAAFSILSSIGTIGVAVLKGREMVTKAALEAVGSLEGRNVVQGIVADKQSRIEEKLDTLTVSVNGMASALRTQMNQMSTEMRDLTVRLAVIEDRRGGREDK